MLFSLIGISRGIDWIAHKLVSNLPTMPLNKSFDCGLFKDLNVRKEKKTLMAKTKQGVGVGACEIPVT